VPEVELKCNCGQVRGKTKTLSPSAGTRIACCCDDCQRYAEWLGQEDTVLDEYGGTDIFQMPVSFLKISEGNEHISCVRLGAKGMYRWYAKCCNTPIGNTMGKGVPFIGVVHSFMNHASTRKADLGESRGYIQTKFAKKEVPENLKAASLGTMLRSLSKLMLWKFKGFNKPTAFFDTNGNPVTEPNVLADPKD